MSCFVIASYAKQSRKSKRIFIFVLDRHSRALGIAMTGNIPLFFDLHHNEYLRESISSDVEVHNMRASSFYMRAVREFYIFFLEIDAIFCLQTSSDLMFIQSTEDLISLSFEGEFECLTFELFLDIECLEESHACLIGGSFFLGIDLLHTFWSDLFRESFRDEVVASLRRRDFDHLSMSTEIRDIDEELDGEFCWRHISRGFRIAQIYGKCDSLQEIINSD